MTVEVMLNNGSKIYPGYAPDHKEEVIGYYTNLYWKSKIQWFKVTLDSGEIIAMGA
jgi:hypothetical protein